MKDLITLKSLTLNVTVFILLLVSINSSDIKKQCAESRIESIESSIKLYCPNPAGLREVLNSNVKGSDFGYALNNSEPGNVNGETSSLIEKLRKDEYNISYSDELGTYQSPNRSNNLRFIYHKDGFTAHTREVKRETSDGKRLSNVSDEWSIDFRLRDLGRTDKKEDINDLCSMFSSELKASGNKAHSENENIRIDYTNNEEGMRQDFIVKNKPLGEGKLRLTISANTKLKMTVGADEVKFKDINGDEIMKYSSLKVWDADGRELKANFEKTDKLQMTNDKLQSIEKRENPCGNVCNLQFAICNCFSIVVNDEDAVYPITIDPLSAASASWFAESNLANSNFGTSVSTAGDVNGDGYSDVIVGAPYFDNGQPNEGRVFVYYGSATGLSDSVNWTADSNQETAHFGYSVSTAGDVNNDGYSDVIVGAKAYDNGQINEGRAFVFHGSASGLSDIPNWTAESDQANALFGYSVSTAGDVNGDGYSDVIIGAPYDKTGQSIIGRAYVYHGSSTGLSISNNWTAESIMQNAEFGFSVSTAGDVNGDGFSDVIVGSPSFHGGQAREGKVFVYYGSNAGLSLTTSWSIERDQAYTEFGISVSSAGDVNGDGYSDVIIGQHKYINIHSFIVGRVIVYYGSGSGLTSVNWTFDQTYSLVDGYLGNSVSCAGDVDGDGYSDILVGAYKYRESTNGGAAYVFKGAPNGLPSTYIWVTHGNQANAQYGYSVSGAGDVNGDGYSDVIIGSNYYDNVQTNEGRAFVYNGSADDLSTSVNYVKDINQDSAHFGYSVATAGDINGDGYGDVIVGAPFYDNGETGEGKAYVYNGSASGISATESWTAEADLDSANFGTCVAGAGDVNGDGFSDVIVGAPLFKNSPSDTYGKVFVYYGSASGLSNTAGWTVTGSQLTKSLFGNNVSAAGDVNGDGYGDVLVGENKYANGQFDEGRACLYYGSASGLLSVPAWTYESNNANANLGISTSSAGDVNGDGFSDILIGAYTFSNGQVAEGRTFVFHGSSAGIPAVANWTYETNVANSYFGWSVSSAGDVNADGFGDVIIGARNFNNGQIGEGRAYIFHGTSSGLLNTPNRTYESNQVNAYMGWSVSSAGDVNSDGYSDVLISMKDFDNNITDQGRVVAMYGSSAGLPINQSWYADGIQSGENFGQSVSSAGDLNGDGYSDIVIGADLFENSQTYEGRIDVFLGNEVSGKNQTLRQYKPGTASVVSSGGLTGTSGQVKINMPGRSTYGRAKGKLVYEYMANGFPFSGAVITNSVSSTGSGPFTDLGISGVQLSSELSGIPVANEYKWRARIQYDPVSNPYQKFGPWRYYQNNFPVSFGGFKPKEIPFSIKTLNLTMLIQGFYDSSNDSQMSDTVTCYLRNQTSPFAIVDNAAAVVSSDGSAVLNFGNAPSGNYYIVITHRNSIETWSANGISMTGGGSVNYDFTNSTAQAYGSNQIQVDASPVKFAIFGGDVNQDGTVDATDVALIDNDAANFNGGYIVTDLTGDSFVDGTDFAIADNNAGNFVSVIRP